VCDNDDLNLYAYVGNDPLDKTDPTGLQEILFDIFGKPPIEFIEPVAETAAKVGDAARSAKPSGPAPSGPQRGQYRIDTQSNKWYVGKGTPGRMQRSVQRIEKAGEQVTSSKHNPSNPNTDRQAFKDEAQAIRDAGGIKDPNSLNKYNSPGEKMLPPPPSPKSTAPAAPAPSPPSPALPTCAKGSLSGGNCSI
jgi:uncharacterized protein RhaS with RHS repeats